MTHVFASWRVAETALSCGVRAGLGHRRARLAVVRAADVRLARLGRSISNARDGVELVLVDTRVCPEAGRPVRGVLLGLGGLVLIVAVWKGCKWQKMAC